MSYPVVQRESISWVPPDESVATPVAPKWKPQNRHWLYYITRVKI